MNNGAHISSNYFSNCFFVAPPWKQNVKPNLTQMNYQFSASVQ